MRGARGALRGCLLLVAFSSLALHCGPDFSVSCTLTYRKALLPRSHRFCDRTEAEGAGGYWGS
ncbi:BQ5605_C028g10449 [Microbotryum silenes-dioicae]|uniref:BQ5605_C028g10449 protein n=1 Tax=Microbotryum silenes-dioicae TaxID=796604 RepID=A0A2X0MLV2_9BASI|nr:BQ5605_C028g10449 [Microbotryum silenes-dioicae]